MHQKHGSCRHAFGLFALAMCALAGCSPKITSKDPGERLRAIASVSDPQVLARLSIEDPAENVRTAAAARIRPDQLPGLVLGCVNRETAVALARKISNPQDRAQVAFQATDEAVGVAAITGIADRAVLDQLMARNRAPAIRAAALRQTRDQALMVQTLLGQEQEGAMIAAALESLTDPEAMITVMLGNTDPAVSNNLVAQISDETTLARLALAAPPSGTDEDKSVPAIGDTRLLIEKINDPALLVRIACESADTQLGDAAGEKLADADNSQVFQKQRERMKEVEWLGAENLVAVATTESNCLIRAAAVRRLGENPVLAKLAIADPAPVVRAACAHKLGQAALLARLAQDDPAPLVRSAALERLTDQAVLAVVAERELLPRLRAKAAAKLTDSTLCARLACEGHALVREAAMNGVRDIALLERLALNDPEFRLRVGAMRAITDDVALGRIACASKDLALREETVVRIIDVAVLMRIAAGDEHPAIRKCAMAKLTDQEFCLHAALADPDAEVRDVAASRVECEDETTARRLMKELAAGDIHRRDRLCRVLRGRSAAFKPFLEGTRHTDALVRRFSLEALAIGYVGEEEVVARLFALSDDPDPGVRRTVSRYLTERSGPEEIRELLKRLQNASPAARRCLLMALVPTPNRLAEDSFDIGPVLAVAANQTDRLWAGAALMSMPRAALPSEVLEVRGLVWQGKYEEAYAAGPVGIAMCTAAIADRLSGSEILPRIEKLGWRPASDEEAVLRWLSVDGKKSLPCDARVIEEILHDHIVAGRPETFTFCVRAAADLDESRFVPELQLMLNERGTKPLAEACLRSSHSALVQAALSWAARNGYEFHTR